MKTRKISKKILVGALALVMTASTFMPVLEANAASGSLINAIPERRTICSDGAELRKQGYSGGKLLATMKKGESINFYTQILGSDPEYNYMNRLKTGTYGYVDHHYTK